MSIDFKHILDRFLQYENKIQLGKNGVVQQDWIDYVESKLGFMLPESYKWISKEFEFVAFDNEHIKQIAPFELFDVTDIDILDSYKSNLKNGILNEDQLSILQFDDELYYFKIEKGIERNEYKVYMRDYHLDDKDKIYADNFLEFLERKLNEQLK